MANIFPRGSNFLPLKIILCLAVAGCAVSLAVPYYFTPKYTRVGYQPQQPVNFSHQIHAGELGMDCRYCHSFVEVAAHSNVPTTQVCMNCHSQVQKENPKLAPVRESWATGKSIEWVQIHKTPDYVYFNHSAHVNRGVSCVSCHGKVNEMAVVYHAESHSMSWCLDCHRAPQDFVRPLDKITDLNWEAPQLENESKKEAQQRVGKGIVEKLQLNPPDKNCAGCHR